MKAQEIPCGWRERSSRNEHTQYCFLPGHLSLPPCSSRPLPGVPRDLGCPITLGFQCCLGGVWCGWAAVQEPLRLVFSWPLPLFPVWGMPEEQVAPRVPLQLAGDVAARERETHWCPFPCLHSQHPRPAGAQGCGSAGDPAVVRTSAMHAASRHQPRAHSGRGHPDPNGGAELISHGGPGAVAGQSQHEAAPQQCVRPSGTAAVREQDAGVRGTPIRCVHGAQVWHSKCLAGADKPHGPCNAGMALPSCNGPRPRLRHCPNLAVLLPGLAARRCTPVWRYLLERLLHRAGTCRD